MSYDRQIDQVCQHLVAQEALFLNTDQQSIRPLKPIASIASVSVRLNGQIQVPSTGVLLPATATGKALGPFTIITGVNDALAMRVDQGTLQTVTVPPATSLSAASLVAKLNGLLSGVFFSTVGNQVLFQSLTTGPGGSVYLDPSSTMAPLLGLPAPREFRGQMAFPGWTLVRDLTSLTNPPVRLIVFDTMLRSYLDFVEINYTTAKHDCRRCGGIGVENDWKYGRTGEVIQVLDEALLVQEIQKLFLTARGSNVFHAFYGTMLVESIGKKLSAGGQVQNLMVADIVQTFKMWQDVKRKQEETVGQYVSDEEYPYRLLNASLTPSNQDPTVVFLSVTIQNRSQKKIVLDRGLKLPAGFDIATFQQGLIQQSLRNPVLAG